MESMWKIYFQIGGGILLLLGAASKSKFDGLKSRNIDFRDFLIFGTYCEPLFVDSNIPDYYKLTDFRKSQIVFERYFWETIGNTIGKYIAKSDSKKYDSRNTPD